MAFQLEIYESGETLLIKVGGRVVLDECERFKTSCISFVRPGLKKVAVEMSEVDFIDSAGLGVLVGLKMTSNKVKAKLSIISPSQAVADILYVSKLDGIFDVATGAPADVLRAELCQPEFLVGPDPATMGGAPGLPPMPSGPPMAAMPGTQAPPSAPSFQPPSMPASGGGGPRPAQPRPPGMPPSAVPPGQSSRPPAGMPPGVSTRPPVRMPGAPSSQPTGGGMPQVRPMGGQPSFPQPGSGPPGGIQPLGGQSASRSAAPRPGAPPASAPGMPPGWQRPGAGAPSAASAQPGQISPLMPERGASGAPMDGIPLPDEGAMSLPDEPLFAPPIGDPMLAPSDSQAFTEPAPLEGMADLQPMGFLEDMPLPGEMPDLLSEPPTVGIETGTGDDFPSVDRGDSRGAPGGGPATGTIDEVPARPAARGGGSVAAGGESQARTPREMVEMHCSRAFEYMRQGSYEESIREYKRALEFNPDYLPAHNNLAIVFEKKPSWHPQAVATWERVYELSKAKGDQKHMDRAQKHLQSLRKMA